MNTVSLLLSRLPASAPLTYHSKKKKETVLIPSALKIEPSPWGFLLLPFRDIIVLCERTVAKRFMKYQGMVKSPCALI